MPSIITDQLRLSTASNFVDSVVDSNNSYYVFLGLPNSTATTPGGAFVGFGRTSTWTSTGTPPSPIDNFEYASHYKDTMMFGKKITSSNVRRVVKKYDWSENTTYDMYRHDYQKTTLSSPYNKTKNLSGANYYVITDEFKVYLCIKNGSSGSQPNGSPSRHKPTFTDLEPSPANTTDDDGYIWKYLFTVSPSDVIKFDSTEYIILPENWNTTTDSQIKVIRESGDSNVNKNQIKTVYIENSGGSGYSDGIYDIVGDGSGAKVSITVNGSGQIIGTSIVSGGSGYTYGVVDLKSGSNNSPATLVPIIPPSRGHGYDIYRELLADKVLIYARFDDSTKDYPVDTNFAQVGILKNPEQQNSTDLFTLNEFSSLESIKLSNSTLVSTTNYVGAAITQTVNGQIARGYVASYDSDTQVLKYFQDRSLNFGDGTTNVDNANVGSEGSRLKFGGTGQINGQTPSFSVNIDTGFSGVTTTVNGKIINLGSSFTAGVSTSQINKKTGDIIYIDNRTPVSRDLRQKEDVKIILEF